MIRSISCAIVICTCLNYVSLQSTNVRAEFRTFDGTGNNLAHAAWCWAGTTSSRMPAVDYGDKLNTARLTVRPNPRSVGNALFRQSTSRPNNRLLSGYVYAWGNFISHDTQNTISGTTEFVSFIIPTGDDIFLPN